MSAMDFVAAENRKPPAEKIPESIKKANRLAKSVYLAPAPEILTPAQVRQVDTDHRPYTERRGPSDGGCVNNRSKGNKKLTIGDGAFAGISSLCSADRNGAIVLPWKRTTYGPFARQEERQIVFDTESGIWVGEEIYDASQTPRPQKPPWSSNTTPTKASKFSKQMSQQLKVWTAAQSLPQQTVSNSSSMPSIHAWS